MKSVRLVLDSDLDRRNIDGNPDLMQITMPLFKPLSYDGTTFGFPRTMLRAFRIEMLRDGEWVTAYETDRNYQRFLNIPINSETDGVRLIPLATYRSDRVTDDYGSSEVHIFSFEVK